MRDTLRQFGEVWPPRRKTMRGWLATRSLWRSVVGEYSHRTEGEGVTHAGALRSKNVGTSNRNGGESPPRRKTKVSYSMSIRVGLVGPKPMAKAAGDG